MRITTFEEFKDLAQRGTFVPVCKEIVADLLTPVSAFLKIAEHSDYAFLLESVEGGEHVGRYSFLGKDPFLILRARDGGVLVRAGQTEASVDLASIAGLVPAGVICDRSRPACAISARSGDARCAQPSEYRGHLRNRGVEWHACARDGVGRRRDAR